jgi:hypothetical protein
MYGMKYERVATHLAEDVWLLKLFFKKHFLFQSLLKKTCFSKGLSGLRSYRFSQLILLAIFSKNEAFTKSFRKKLKLKKAEKNLSRETFSDFQQFFKDPKEKQEKNIALCQFVLKLFNVDLDTCGTQKKNFFSTNCCKWISSTRRFSFGPFFPEWLAAFDRLSHIFVAFFIINFYKSVFCVVCVSRRVSGQSRWPCRPPARRGSPNSAGRSAASQHELPIFAGVPRCGPPLVGLAGQADGFTG